MVLIRRCSKLIQYTHLSLILIQHTTVQPTIYLYQWLRFESGPKVFWVFFYCKIECGWVLENPSSKRHGLIQLRSIKNVDSGIVSMYAIYEAKGHVPCLGTIEALYLSVFNFEDRTLKTIEFCVGLYKLLF